MKLLMTGGTGLIGQHFIDLYGEQYQITVTSRSPERAAQQLGDKVKVIAGVDAIDDIGEFDAVINLQGAGIADKRWSAHRKQTLQNSRWQVTEKLAQMINASAHPPQVFLSGSAIGVYGPRDSQPVDEDAVAQQHDFAVTLCEQWEQRAQAAAPQTRVVLLRTGVVLAAKGGALERMALPYKLGLGGPMGSGEQMMSWIHIDDMVRGIDYLLHHQDIHGAVNMTAPGPVSNKAFSKTLASVLNKPHFMRVPASALKLMLGEMSVMLLEGQAVVPNKLRHHRPDDASANPRSSNDGFEFKFPTLRQALSDLLV